MAENPSKAVLGKLLKVKSSLHYMESLLTDSLADGLSSVFLFMAEIRAY